MFRDRGILFYPLVLATFPVIFFYAQNPDVSLSFLEVFAPLGIVTLGTFLAVLSLRLFIEDTAKVSVIVSILLVVFFSYGPAHDLVSGQNGLSVAGVSIGRHRYLLTVYALMTLIGASLTLRFRGNLAPLTRAVMAGALLLVVLNVARIGVDTLSDLSADSAGREPFESAFPFQPEVAQLPDIYYIILDAYARADVLEEIHGYDNSEFIDFLTEKGFYVASESRSNYVDTSLSLASSLNMRYLADGVEVRREVEDNAVALSLRSIGYRYVHLGSGIDTTKRNKNADVEILADAPPYLTEFTCELFKRTIVGPIASGFGGNFDLPCTASFAQRFNANMESLREIPDMPGPTFTFSHNLPPHSPFLFDRDGNFLKTAVFELGPSGGNESDVYIDQLIFVNRTVAGVVEEILERSTGEPIIVIQGDHGSAYAGITDWENPSSRFIFERVSILNAYYLPKGCRSGLYPAISPVNTFRMVFDRCLGAELGLLEDKSYWSREGNPIDFSRDSR